METSTIAYQEKVQKPTISSKIDAYSFWESQGPILEHYQERGLTINSAHYSEMLIDRLKTEIRSKHQEQLSKGIVLLNDNICILLPTQLKPSINSSLRYWLTLYIVLISLLQTITYLVHSRRH